MTPPPVRDHGGGLDAACARWGGRPDDWLDLSTGINPVPYRIPDIATNAWTRLPDRSAERDLLAAARRIWAVPDEADILAAPGTSALIARLPGLYPPGRVSIPGPTYNEHAAAFLANGWRVDDGGAGAKVLVHPNNPDGRLWTEADADAPFTVIDESFCDLIPEASLVALAARPGTVVLKSFGKFWGLAGLRLGFAIAAPDTIAALGEMIGPWPVSGPASEIGTAALQDLQWAEETRRRTKADAARLDALMSDHGRIMGGTALFRLLDSPAAAELHERLAAARILTRTFPYAADWLRIGLPAPRDWDRLKAALA